MRQILEHLVNEADTIKGSKTLKDDFIVFSSRLRGLTKELKLKSQDTEIIERLQSLSDYKIYDELSKIGKIFRWFIAYKYQPNLIDNWRHNGAYLNDINWIMTKLDAIIYQIKNKD